MTHRTDPPWAGLAALGACVAIQACAHHAPSDDKSSSSSGVTVTAVPVSITAVDTRFSTADAMLASVEMQLAGEPLTTAMGRDLRGYSRDYPAPNVYFDPSTTPSTPKLDLPGFATGIESYEYSKQPMNNLAFESGAGTSLAFGPVLNPKGDPGAAALALLLARVQHFAAGSNAAKNFVKKVDGTDPKNRLGWAGLWPVTHPYRSLDPTIKPVNTVDLQCSISSDDDPNSTGLLLNLDYECDAGSLHLVNRGKQVDATLTPGASGWAAWKYSLWVMNYLQSMHDSAQTAIATVADADLAKVGSPGNTVVGKNDNAPPDAVAGTYLGSSDIEGFQAQLMIEELDNQAQQWLTQLTTTDAVALSGFATIKDALAYNYDAPLRWFPAAIQVSESDDPSGFPQPTGYKLSESGSHLLDLLGLGGAYADLYALTDHANTNVGGSQPAKAYFDGDPFGDDNQIADGEASMHDRALGMLRVLIVNLDRLHRDPASGILVDDVTFTGSTPARGTSTSTTSVAYAIVGLRTMRRALGSQLELYTNTTPDTAVAGTKTALDQTPLAGAPNGAKLVADRLGALIDAEAKLLLEHLTTADGHALPGWNVAQNAPSSGDDALDAHAAAIRGLLAAYLATGNTSYRDRATAVFTRMDRDFYHAGGRVYVDSPGAAKSVKYSARRFALLEGALRDIYELVAAQPGQGALKAHVEARIARLIKLVLNGWDDIDDNGLVDYPNECMRVVGGLPRGGLQLAERSLTGEIGSVCEKIDASTCKPPGPRKYIADRDHDCVPEISAAGLPSALGNEITFSIGR